MKIMKKTFYLLCFFSLVLLGCKALKPSADLSEFAPYFTKDEQTGTIEKAKIRVTFFGTSTLLFDDGNSLVMIDGFFSRPKVGKVAFGKLRSDEALIRMLIKKYNMHRLEAIFVCHSHYDHAMDAPLLSKLTGATLYGSSSTMQLGKGEQVPAANMQEFEPGKRLQIADFAVTVLHSKHTPPFKILGKTNATDPKHPHIEKPLSQPAKTKEYIEGGSYDMYIEHGKNRFLVKASTNYIEGALDAYPCDVLFLGTAMLGKMPADFMESYYRQTVKSTRAKIVIPIHWDNFMKPFHKPLIPLPYISDDVAEGFRFLLKKTAEDSLQMRLMQMEQSLLF